MLSPKRAALCLAISAMALTASEAVAGCKYIPNPPGSLVCASWITGSDICKVESAAGDLTGPPFGAPPLTNVTCSITGAIFLDNLEGGDDAAGAYCKSGFLPPGLCTPAKKTTTTLSTSTSVKTAAAPNSSHPPNPCIPNAPAVPTLAGPLPICPGLVIPGGGDTIGAQNTPTCTGPSDDAVCPPEDTEIPLPSGSTCFVTGKPAADFTARAMLAITEVTVCTSFSGTTCLTTVTDKIYDFCLVDPTSPAGTQYACLDITDQGTRCDNPSGNPLTFDPDDPSCGQVRTCGD